ncbi:MAG: stage II sporulation protein M [Methanobacterium paludis]|uniref:Uncharacterized protein n=1 Tax=Methanobacterium paludis (strain DSM 25820 / JCM 18151 / SWAN1) TaxID=868131 RepID=F6D743_METPW|nr:stage II sporulation protein M [Methanobacterium paludis]AEG18410.1 protein of unknown function DUF95 transmembrane [Methanobacterium paludis]MCE7698029.1 stage II sporulation protein M [Methanobacterium paludis]
MKRYTKIGAVLVTVLLTVFAGLTGFFESLFWFLYPVKVYMFYLNSVFLMLGICLNIISEFVEKRKKLLFNSSILITVIGLCIVSVIWGYTHPEQVTNISHAYNLTDFLTSSISIFLGNVLGNLLAILLSPTILAPYFILSHTIYRSYDITGVVNYYGVNGLLYFLLQPHIYVELFATALSLIAGFKIVSKTVKSVISIKSIGVKNSLIEIKDAVVYELKNTMPKVIILLLIAALLETLFPIYLLGKYLLGVGL